MQVKTRRLGSMLPTARFDALKNKVSTSIGSIIVTQEEGRIMNAFFRHGPTISYSHLVPGILDMPVTIALHRRRALQVHVCVIRRRLGALGLDIVTIADYGYRLDDLEHGGARRRVKVEYSKPADAVAAPRVTGLKAPMSTADRLRALDLHDRGFSVQAIARSVNKPYREIERALSGAGAA